MEKKFNILDTEELKKNSDRIKFDNRCSTFDLCMYFTTGFVSWYNIVIDKAQDFNNKIVLLLIYSVPIIFKHLFALDVYKSINKTRKKQKFRNVVNKLMSVLCFGSGFSLIVLLSLYTKLSYSDLLINIITIIYVVLFITGFYDKVMLNEKKGDDIDD